jgi:dihydrofolate reductase
LNRTGAAIIGKRMFIEGEANWPENAPFHCPVYVLTNEYREPWERKGGTTFYFINDGMQSALEKAKKAAGSKDIRISGGANVIQQFLNAGLTDELAVHLAPIFLGQGVKLFEKIDKEKIKFENIGALHSNLVTHLNYNVIHQ